MAKQRGGARIGAGRPREYLHLDKEIRQDLEDVAILLRTILEQPDLSEEQVIQFLLHDARQQLETSLAQATHQAQESVRLVWQKKVGKGGAS